MDILFYWATKRFKAEYEHRNSSIYTKVDVPALLNGGYLNRLYIFSDNCRFLVGVFEHVTAIAIPNPNRKGDRFCLQTAPWGNVMWFDPNTQQQGGFDPIIRAYLARRKNKNVAQINAVLGYHFRKNHVIDIDAIAGRQLGALANTIPRI
jgi:hypothetical protein